MFLKIRYRLGYESLCREVADSISWQRFCRIPLGTRVPHPTTLMKITTRCGDAAVAALNEALLAKAAAGKLLRTDKVRLGLQHPAAAPRIRERFFCVIEDRAVVSIVAVVLVHDTIIHRTVPNRRE